MTFEEIRKSETNLKSKGSKPVSQDLLELLGLGI